MLLSYGYTELEYSGEIYRFTPSFKNIERIGSPKDIINVFEAVVNPANDWYVVLRASLRVLSACCDKTISVDLMGESKLSQWSKNIVYAKPKSGMTIEQVRILAIHMLSHGVVGKVDIKTESGNQKITDFDVSEYIESAVIALGMSYEEASNMTMTQFVKCMRSKFPDIENKESETRMGVTAEEQIHMVKEMQRVGLW